MKKYLKYWPIAILALLLLTNPSISAFKAYRGSVNYANPKRPLNLFICSVYQDHNLKFLGFLGNFVPVNAPGYKVDSGKVDSTKKDPFAEFGGHAISN